MFANKTADASGQIREITKAANSAKSDLTNAKQKLAKAQADKKAADDAAAKAKAEQEAAAQQAAAEQAAWNNLANGDCSVIAGNWKASMAGLSGLTINSNCTGSYTSNSKFTFPSSNPQSDGSYSGRFLGTTTDDLSVNIYPVGVSVECYSWQTFSSFECSGDKSRVRIYIGQDGIGDAGELYYKQ